MLYSKVLKNLFFNKIMLMCESTRYKQNVPIKTKQYSLTSNVS
jgi:hypothetical protein